MQWKVEAKHTLCSIPVPRSVELMYLHHGSTSTGAALWFKKVMCEEKLNQFTIKKGGAKQVTVVVDLENASFAQFHIAKRSHLLLLSRRLLMLRHCLQKLYICYRMGTCR